MIFDEAAEITISEIEAYKAARNYKKAEALSIMLQYAGVFNKAMPQQQRADILQSAQMIIKLPVDAI